MLWEGQVLGIFYLAQSPEPTAPARQWPNDFSRPGKIHWQVSFFFGKQSLRLPKIHHVRLLRIQSALNATAPPRQGPNDFSRPRKIHWGVFFCVEASCASKHPQPGAVARRGPNDFFRPGKRHWRSLSATAPAHLWPDRLRG